MMVRLNPLHKKFLVVSLGVSGLIIIHKIMSEQAHCLPGEICESKPPHDWKLKPYNGLDEDHPVRRRFLEERERAANGEIDSMSISFGKTKKPDNFLYEMFATQQETKERVITKTEIKVKEVYIPQPCETDLKLANQKYVRNCITNEIIGKIPPNAENIQFDVKETRVFPAKENVAERQRSFQRVYETNAWGKNWDPGYNDLNGSGRGATLSWTQELTATLHIVINTIKVTLGVERVRILDVPCGDMAWMSRFLLTRDDIDYTGIDIVPELIQHHKSAYKGYPWRFMQVDLLENPLDQSYHLILCRMLLQHLYFREVVDLLSQFSQSNSSFLLTTTFLGVQHNEELVTDAENPGRVRMLNLELPPLSLSPPYCVQRDGPRGDFEGWKHFVGLWKLPLTRVGDCSQTYAMSYPGYQKVKMYSCTNWQ